MWDSYFSKNISRSQIGWTNWFDQSKFRFNIILISHRFDRWEKTKFENVASSWERKNKMLWQHTGRKQIIFYLCESISKLISTQYHYQGPLRAFSKKIIFIPLGLFPFSLTSESLLAFFSWPFPFMPHLNCKFSIFWYTSSSWDIFKPWGVLRIPKMASTFWK